MRLAPMPDSAAIGPASSPAAHGVTLKPSTDAQGRTVAECVSFGGGQTWGPIALADVSLAGEVALNLPVQILSDGGNTDAGTVNFAIADPNTFVAGASAFIDLAGGAGSSGFDWGMPFLYGRKVYVGIDQRIAGTHTGPDFAY